MSESQSPALEIKPRYARAHLPSLQKLMSLLHETLYVHIPVLVHWRPHAHTRTRTRTHTHTHTQTHAYTHTPANTYAIRWRPHAHTHTHTRTHTHTHTHTHTRDTLEADESGATTSRIAFSSAKVLSRLVCLPCEFEKMTRIQLTCRSSRYDTYPFPLYVFSLCAFRPLVAC